MTKTYGPTATYLKVFHGWYTVDDSAKTHNESAEKEKRKAKTNTSSKRQKKNRKGDKTL